jgi:hypothetical protein
LVDPFLGSEALQRVIARQRHENIDLTILISPGDVNPDAENPDTKAVESHSKKLVDTANEWSDRLRGKISIVDVQRGDGQRQAFHDRYLVVTDQNGVPTAFLFSNSMSKAAGDWPFAICELDQVTSHRVKAYIEDLLQGVDGGRTVKPIIIWSSVQSQPVESVTDAAKMFLRRFQDPRARLVGILSRSDRTVHRIDRSTRQPMPAAIPVAPSNSDGPDLKWA